jgi:H/ACA ribonucleoprotein complex non-core subunit NAF1
MEDDDEESRITKQHKKNKAQLSRLVAEDNDSDDDSDSMGEKKRNITATAHEITVPTVILPSITEIGPDEPMELIGEVLNVVDSVVVVKSSHNGMQRVLDTESLLVFEDRKVLGLVSGFVGVSFSMQMLTR